MAVALFLFAEAGPDDQRAQRIDRRGLAPRLPVASMVILVPVAAPSIIRPMIEVPPTVS